MMLKRSPLGSSFVIITPFWRIEIGKMLGGGGNSSATVGSRDVCVFGIQLLETEHGASLIFLDSIESYFDD